jgi:rSAM/selenodomain-associated transferase 2
LAQLADLDRPADLPAWHRLVAVEDAATSRVSVVIPALNEESQLRATLQAARQGCPHEIIIVDGGSADETCAIAQKSGATVIHSKPGRARQMNAGAARATGDTLLFLHADTLLPPDWPRVVSETLRQPSVAAGAFRFHLAGSFPGKWLVEWGASLRSHWRQMPYGDQTLFVRRPVFEELGGFAALPIMEDYEFVGRLRRRGRVVTADEPAVTSGRRWRRLGVLRATLINRLVITGYHLGICPHRLARFYRGSTGR